MDLAHLDNPLWATASTGLSAHATFKGKACRTQPEIGPFAAVREATREAEMDLCDLVQPGEQVGLAGVIPPFSERWEIEREASIFQMVAAAVGTEPVDQAGMRLLGPEDVTAMLELTSLVYPAYFRAGTATLGDYYGIFEEGQLCAMAGERFRMPGIQEVSAVCTHPAHTGRGFAHRLVRHLVRTIQTRGDLAILHVDDDNERAISVYERVGFRIRKKLPLCAVTRR